MTYRQREVRYRWFRRVGWIAILALGVQTAAPAAEAGVRAAEQAYRRHQAARAQQPTQLPDVRVLRKSEMQHLKGRGRIPSLAGQAKWDVVDNGLNLRTGNYTYTTTDLTLPGAIGIPVSVVRTWNANDDREGPFGVGWSWSLDVRQAAGGLIKRSASPSRTVPTQLSNGRQVNLVQITIGEGGPSVSGVTVDGAQCQDASGEQWIAWRDADGLYTPPPWDHNEYESTYRSIVVGTGENQYLREYAVTTKVTTPDGTVYFYEAVEQDGGLPVALDARGNEVYSEQVLKWVEDRHGNRTSYEYTIRRVPHRYRYALRVSDYDQRCEGTEWVEGVADVNKAYVRAITNAAGFELKVRWNFDIDSSVGANARVVEIASSDGRVVRYGYGPEGSEFDESLQNWQGSVTAVASPGGRITRYGYTDWQVNSRYIRIVESFGLSTSELWILNRVTDADDVRFEIGYNSGERYHGSNEYEEYRDFINRRGYAVLARYVKLPDGSVRQLFSPGTSSYVFLANESLNFLDHCNPSDRNLYGKVSWRFFYYVEDPHDRQLLYGVFSFTRDYFDVQRTFDSLTGNLLYEQYTDVGGSDSFSWGCAEMHFRCAPFMERARQDDTQNIPNSCYSSSGINVVEKSIEYNCMGAPYRVEQKTLEDFGWGNIRLFSKQITDVRYWGKERYYQKRIEVNTSYIYDSAGRLSSPVRTLRTFYDYHDSNASPGYRGMLRAIYADPYSVFRGTGVDDSQPQSLDPAQDDIVRPLARVLRYNPHGQSIETKTLQRISPIRWVRTRTEYDSRFYTPKIVVEDADGVNRVSETLYNDFGHPHIQRTYERVDNRQRVVRELTTDYLDADGLVQSVRLTHDGRQPVNRRLVSYEYTRAGRVCTSVDHLSNVRGVVEYDNGGRPRLYQEFWGDKERYSLESLYDGSDLTEKILTVQGQGVVARWKYKNYLSGGDIPFRRVPTRVLFYRGVNRDDNAPDEVIDYLYDKYLRLRAVRFAVVPMGENDQIRGGGRTLRRDLVEQLLDEQYPKSFAFVWYAYNPDGGVNDVRYYVAQRRLDEGGYYTDQYSYRQVTRFQYFQTSGNVYIPMYDARGNRLGMIAHDELGNIVRRENYVYDDLNRLIRADYWQQGRGGWSNSWTYDVMGNRSDAGQTWVYDGLNRLVSRPGVSYQHDILGNRLRDNQYRYQWDALNRLAGMQRYYRFGNMEVSGESWRFAYRADGLRVLKECSSFAKIDDGISSGTRTEYLYDGQMPVCEQEFVGSTLRTTRVNLLGARGIEAVLTIDHTRGDQTTLNWLLYDGHGNLVRTMSPNYTLSGFQWRGAWGEVQNSLGTGRGYCANIGHLEDETGLVYMRARYYEPTTGRFISEDPARDGVNWFLYANANPTNIVDPEGRKAKRILGYLSGIYGVYQAFLALMDFLNAIQTATDPLQVEEAWGEFMSTWADRAVDYAEKSLESYFKTLAKTLARASIVGYLISTFIDSAINGAYLVILAIGYQARIAYYIELIDQT